GREPDRSPGGGAAKSPRIAARLDAVGLAVLGAAKSARRKPDAGFTAANAVESARDRAPGARVRSSRAPCRLAQRDRCTAGGEPARLGRRRTRQAVPTDCRSPVARRGTQLERSGRGAGSSRVEPSGGPRGMPAGRHGAHAQTSPARLSPAFPSPPPGWKGGGDGSPPPPPAVPGVGPPPFRT